MASEAAVRAADAVFMALTGTAEGKPDAMVGAIMTSYEELAQATTVVQAGVEAGRALGGHIELSLLLLTQLVMATGKSPDELLRGALGR